MNSMNRHLHRMKSRRLQQGFTMAELIIVIAILAVLIVYLVRNFGVRSDDAKIAMVGNILSKDVPAAFQAFILENNGCMDPSANDANIENFLNGGADDFTNDLERTGIKLLLDNGVPAGTPWRNAHTADAATAEYDADYSIWDAEFHLADGDDSAYLSITYPLDGVGNVGRAREVISTKLKNSSEVHSVNGAIAAGGLGRPDVATAAGTDDTVVTVHYTCS